MVSTTYDNLRGLILAGALQPGQSLSQVQVARELGVSRGPLREAIRMLQSDGLVETQVNRRARVTPISIEAARASLLYADRGGVTRASGQRSSV